MASWTSKDLRCYSLFAVYEIAIDKIDWNVLVKLAAEQDTNVVPFTNFILYGQLQANR